MAEINLVAALDSKGGIAKSSLTSQGSIPWGLPTDKKHFRTHVEHGPVVMGRNTFAANGYKPFGLGKNYVLSRKKYDDKKVEMVEDGEKFFHTNTQDLWVAGGGQVYALALPYATRLFITRVDGDFDCDVFFPDFNEEFTLVHSEPYHVENGLKFHCEVWERTAIILK